MCFRWIVLLGMQLFLSHGVWASECEPTYRRVSEQTTEVGHLSIKTSWALIGCRAQLDQIGPKDMSQAKSTLAAVVSEQAWGLMVFEKDLNLRRAVADRLNRTIGRAAIGDVLLLYYNIEE